MQCYVHSESEAVASCKNCGKAICKFCSVDVSGKIYCQQCLASGTTTSAPSIKTNSLAIISIVLGLIGLCGCLITGGGLLFGIPAAITGRLARKQIQEDNQEQRGFELATAGLVLGLIEIVFSVLFIVLMIIVFGGTLGFSTIFALLGMQNY